MYHESTGNMRASLGYLADRGDQEVTSRELADHLQAPKGTKSVDGMIGAFAGRCWNRYDRYVPWDSWWQGIGDGERSEAVFVMSAVIADYLRTLRD